MRKKVLFVITKSNFGGAQRYVFDLATHLRGDRFEVVVACGPGQDGKTGRLSHMLDAQQIPTIEIPELGRDINFLSDVRAFFALVGLFRAEKPDVVHLNSSKAGGLGAFAARIARVPRIIFTSHGLAYDEDRAFMSRLLIGIATWLTIILSHRTIMISSDTFERARKLPFAYRRVVLIYNGIVPPDFETPAEARKALRTIDPSIPESGHLAGFVGELHPNKDIATSLRALALTPKVHLVIIGDGELRTSLMEIAKEINIGERVHFLGFIQDAPRYLRALDVFLLTSIKEGLPYVLLEAGAAHVPIIATDIAGVRDIVLPDFTGILVKPRDENAVAHSLTRLLETPPLAQSLADELTTRMQKTFSLSVMIEKTVALY